MHRRSIRLRAYDYRTAGAYFVTVCTHGRAPLLARLDRTGGLCLTEAGWIVTAEWRRLPERRPEVRLDAFVAMPDHIHFVMWIEDVRGQGPGGDGRGTINCAPTDMRQRFGHRHTGGLAVVVGAFKAGVTRRINEGRGMPGAAVWQRGYYEHVVRGAADLARIRRYIAENPARWGEKHASHPFTPPSMRPWM